MKEIVLNIAPDGVLQFVHDDELQPLVEQAAKPEVVRVSEVEHSAREGGWMADLGRIEGPRFGPFPRRHDAIACEVAFLNTMLANGSKLLPERE